MKIFCGAEPQERSLPPGVGDVSGAFLLRGDWGEAFHASSVLGKVAGSSPLLPGRFLGGGGSPRRGDVVDALLSPSKLLAGWCLSSVIKFL